MKMTFTPQELLYLYDCLIRDNRDKNSSAYSSEKETLLSRVRNEILRCLEKDYDETTSKQYKIWNENESKKIKNLERVNNDVKLNADIVKKFSEQIHEK